MGSSLTTTRLRIRKLRFRLHAHSQCFIKSLLTSLYTFIILMVLLMIYRYTERRRRDIYLLIDILFKRYSTSAATTIPYNNITMCSKRYGAMWGEGPR